MQPLAHSNRVHLPDQDKESQTNIDTEEVLNASFFIDLVPKVLFENLNYKCYLNKMVISLLLCMACDHLNFFLDDICKTVA